MGGGPYATALDRSKHGCHLPTHPQATGWTGRRFHLGKNKEVFNAEHYTLYRALQTFDNRREQNRRYTTFSASAAALDRAASDRLGPGQRHAAAAIDLCDRLMSRGNSVTIRWTPAHLGVEGNEMADPWAKGVAESTVYASTGPFSGRSSSPTRQ